MKKKKLLIILILLNLILYLSLTTIIKAEGKEKLPENIKKTEEMLPIKNEKEGEVVLGGKLTLLGDFTGGLKNAIRSMKLSGNYLYAVTYVDDEKESVFAVYDVTKPESPERITDIDPIYSKDVGGPVKGIEIQENYAYIVSDNLDKNCFRIIDIADIRHPKIVGGKNLDIFTYGSALAVDGNYAYVGCVNGSFAVIDISNPQSPKVINITDLSTFLYLGIAIWTIKIKGNYAYIGGRPPFGSDPDFIVMDISDKTHPQMVTGLNLYSQDYSGLWTMDIIENEVYMAGGPHICEQSSENKFYIVDISTPSEPEVLGFLPLSNFSANYVKVYNKYAFVTTWTPEPNFYIIDICDLSDPQIVASDTIGICPLSIAKKQNYVYLGLAPIQRNGEYLKVLSLKDLDF